MELTLYSLGKGGAKEEKKATIQIGGDQTAEQALGISAKQLDLSKLDWKTFYGSGDSKSTAKAEEKKSGSFQVQVSVADRYGNSGCGWSYLGQIGIWTRLDRP